MADEGFDRLPVDGFLNWGVAEVFGVRAALLVQRLVYLQGDEGETDRSVYRLARDLRCSERILWKILKRLEEAGVVSRQYANDKARTMTMWVHPDSLRGIATGWGGRSAQSSPKTRGGSALCAPHIKKKEEEELSVVSVRKEVVGLFRVAK